MIYGQIYLRQLTKNDFLIPKFNGFPNKKNAQNNVTLQLNFNSPKK